VVCRVLKVALQSVRGTPDVTKPKTQRHKSMPGFESDGMASQIIVNFEKALLDRLTFYVSKKEDSGVHLQYSKSRSPSLKFCSDSGYTIVGRIVTLKPETY